MPDAVLHEMFRNRNTDIIWIVQGIFCVGLVSERLFFIKLTTVSQPRADCQRRHLVVSKVLFGLMAKLYIDG